MKALFTILMIFCLAAGVWADTNFFVGTGISNPYAPEDFQTYWRGGFGLYGGMGWTKGNLVLGPALYYENFPLDDASYLGGLDNNEFIYSSVAEGGTSILALVAEAKLYSPVADSQRWLPYLLADAGLAMKNIAEKEIFHADGRTIEEKVTDYVPIIGGGIGVEMIAGGRTSVFFQVQGNLLLTDEVTFYVPIRIGIAIK